MYFFSRKCLCSTLTAVFFLWTAYPVAAQQADNAKKNIWSVKTNAFEWLLTIPNVNFEMDLSKSCYNKTTLGLTAKYNWQTFHKITPYYTFDLLDIRPEFRYYYRTRQKSPKEEREKSQGFGRWCNRILTEKKNPRPWRACYIGVYADYASYAFKFSPEGIQGDGFGLGVSVGYGIPLYQYKKIAVDLELGFSLGLFVTKYDRFSYDSDNSCYTVTDHKDLHLTPFPVVSELRASFAFRPVSIQHKYELDDPEKIEYQKTSNDIKNSFENINKEIFDGMHSAAELEQYAADDSLYFAEFSDYLDNSVQYELDRLTDSSLSKKYVKKMESDIYAYKKKIMADFKKEVEAAKKKKEQEEKAAEASAVETDITDTNQ